MSDMNLGNSASDDEIRQGLRNLSKSLRDLGLIGGPDSPTAEYRASRAIRPDQFLDDVMERKRNRGESDEGRGEEN